MNGTHKLVSAESISLSLRDAAKLVGCSFDTLKRAVDDDELAAFRLGRGRKKAKWFVKRTTLLAWIDKLEANGAY